MCLGRDLMHGGPVVRELEVVSSKSSTARSDLYACHSISHHEVNQVRNAREMQRERVSYQLQPRNECPEHLKMLFNQV